MRSYLVYVREFVLSLTQRASVATYVIVKVLMILRLDSNNNEVHSRENREQQFVLFKFT